MNEKKITAANVVQGIKAASRWADRDRASGLKKLIAFHRIKLATQMRSQDRMKQKKMDPEHRRARAVAQKIRRSQDTIKALELEIENTAIDVPEPDPAVWMTHGRVLAKDGKGLKGLTVSYFDKDGHWVRPLGFVSTDDHGYYSLIYPHGPSKGDEISAKQPLYLAVSNSKQQVLYRYRAPLFKRVGLVDSRVMILENGAKLGTPPESGAEPPEKAKSPQKGGKPDPL